jgi:hypothetical protein
VISIFEGLLRVPALRSRLFKMRRVPLRLKRAFLAEAAVVVRSGDGRILVMSPSPGELQLPTKALNGWHNVQHQVEDFLKELVGRSVAVSLVSVEGLVGDIIFLYRANLAEMPSGGRNGRWLPPEIVAAKLRPTDARLLTLCS